MPLVQLRAPKVGEKWGFDPEDLERDPASIILLFKVYIYIYTLGQ